MVRCAANSQPLKITYTVITAYFTYIHLFSYHKPPYNGEVVRCAASPFFFAKNLKIRFFPVRKDK